MLILWLKSHIVFKPIDEKTKQATIQYCVALGNNVVVTLGFTRSIRHQGVVVYMKINQDSCSP